MGCPYGPLGRGDLFRPHAPHVESVSQPASAMIRGWLVTSSAQQPVDSTPPLGATRLRILVWQDALAMAPCCSL